MVRKLSLLAGFGAGYVLGARAGRDRYNQIADKAQQLWRDPRVQAKNNQAQRAAQEQVAHAAQTVRNKTTAATSSPSDGPAEGPGTMNEGL